ncbi:transcriptional regulator SWI6 [Sugiyamaella lignohabitans]|uniref:Transcriptional regulator SWI6 n=1 Tax=Sugiyamaella lignohabitans TaxID=796027 RepID=A0A167FLF9_9ASCO|nr:transcriptional regulator SWI6 [Sugiyamaella lignohabitans]ANB15448.1 transcriptional regulator SWI6 [Sugiyamaella lignohabitans]
MSRNDYYPGHIVVQGDANGNSTVTVMESNSQSHQRQDEDASYIPNEQDQQQLHSLQQSSAPHLERVKTEHRPMFDSDRPAANSSGPIRADYTSSTATIPDEPTPHYGNQTSPQVSLTRTPLTASQSASQFLQSPRNISHIGEAVTPNQNQQSLSASPQLDSNARAKVSDEIYTATYSGVHVFEMIVKGVAVMRRRHDSSLNATQILKVAGVEKSKRTKVLEKEILTGVHEKVQGGYGKYQGTWIPFERAVDLCKQYSVYDVLEPLLKFDSTNTGMENTPTKEQAMAAKRKRTENIHQHHLQMRSNYHPMQYPPSISFSQPLQATGTGGSLPTPLSVSASAALSSLGNTVSGTDISTVYEDVEQKDSKRLKYPENYASVSAASSSSSVGPNSNAVMTATPPTTVENGRASSPALDILDDEGVPDTVIPMSPIPSNEENFDQSREHVTQIFMDNEHDNLTEILGGSDLHSVNFDVPIDEYGHTALHWAAALARIPLIKELVRYGASPRRGNYQGESPLVKAVSVTNNSDYSRFTQLLDVIYPAIPLVDKQSRTVLHHIAITAGIKGRSDSSRYYLESLLEWIVKRGSRSKKGRFSIGRFMSEIVNAQDQNGDTALNIAARIGNKSIAQLLLDVGADATLPNRAGLRPVDFGIKVIENAGALDNNLNDDDAPSTSSVMAAANKNSNHPANQTSQHKQEKRQKVVSNMVQSLESLEKEFEQELKVKEELINSMRRELRESNINLTSRKERLNRLKSLSNQLTQWQRSSQSLERAIAEEDRKFKEQTGDNTPIELEGNNFDADQPFRVWLNSDEIVNGRMPPALLKARIAAYQQNQRELEKLASDLKGRSTELEHKFRKVVAKCTGVDEDQVDSLLPGLVQAVESDPPEVDMSRVTGFLRKVDETMMA